MNVPAFLLFAVIMTGTPGPNNAMVTTSAARIGAWRTMPLVFGVSFGVVVMFVAMAFGLHAVLERLPVLDTLLRVMAALFLVWIAWKILTAGPISDANERPLLGFFGGASFQWINPKAWAFTASAATLHLPVPVSIADIALGAALLGMSGISLVSIWALLGAALRSRLRRPTFAQGFNAAMAALLVLATLPVLFDM